MCTWAGEDKYCPLVGVHVSGFWVCSVWHLKAENYALELFSSRASLGLINHTTVISRRVSYVLARRLMLLFGVVARNAPCSGVICLEDSNLVDSASSHTLVSKIKPCMSKYKSCTLKLRMAHYISYSLFDSPLLLG